ncbi:hypothetical protein BS17DRAFT_389613 [Gyrodon lividus]|nr:hypothetical protein BS17DRAFT_389613 [Gyrodon lividus]
MTSTALWLGFRKFRTVDFSIASILCLIWSLVISVYTAKNWSSYDGGGFLLGLIALDFFSAILIYLMIVVKYRFWPDTVRSVVLLSLHIAGAVTFMIYSPHFPCNAFGSAAHCHVFTKVVLAGLWAVSALLLAYGICLPLMVVIPSPPTLQKTGDDPEDEPAAIARGEEIEEEVTDEEKRRSHASSGSRAWLLKNQEGTSPELTPTDLPVPGAPRAHSHASSSLSSFDLPQPSSPLVREIKLESLRGQPHPLASSTVTQAIRAPYISASDRSPNISGSSSGISTSHPLSRSPSLQSFPLPDRFGGEETDGNRVSIVSKSSYTSTNTDHEYSATPVTVSAVPRHSAVIINESASSLSVYSQSSAPSRSTSASARAPPSTTGANGNHGLPRRLPTGRQHQQSARPSTPRSPGQDSVQSVIANVHYPDQEVEVRSPTSGFLSPPLTALPSPSFSADSSQATFELHLSDSSRSRPADVGELPDIVGDRHQHITRQGSVATIVSTATARPPHARNDSTASNVNMNEWRKLVLNAAGKL